MSFEKKKDIRVLVIQKVQWTVSVRFRELDVINRVVSVNHKNFYYVSEPTTKRKMRTKCRLTRAVVNGTFDVTWSPFWQMDLRFSSTGSPSLSLLSNIHETLRVSEVRLIRHWCVTRLYGLWEVKRRIFTDSFNESTVRPSNFSSL